ncbi:uncharacterized protein MONBRDRAFT_8843 [Monosiga brevicollis MX1]|uniref:Myosin motor domain-containing protein n=1 Tax=Monosiga brevicollis TaxID=81824 RepID=A9V1A5_MONBE|nr:uncharacterized protein MONBRDRAFT_8843 [Monosiga brevicollis MX1]EDQ88898.1 predicted protein [Monosiga brevicollis MX1]|eukprot:XP_001746511.1 hypothetical protein [Monosiga brevicollis MX1]
MEATHDLARQDSLNESSLNQALATRFARDLIYTYVGDILLAVNPYADLPLYDNIHSLRYTKVSSKAEHPPHLFAIADAAFTQMMRTRQPQVAVISGESGAGKTFSTRLFIRQVSPSTPGRTNPVLEAFGNAQTVMNSNSSRFGKFIELQFTTQGRVVGARLAHYLLEKARVVSQGEGERNFHIFEMLIEGCDDEERRRTGLHLSDEWQ